MSRTFSLLARQVLRLYPEIAWVNDFRLADPGLAVDRAPVLLAPMAAILGSRVGRMAMSAQLMRSILNSIATRLDEARDVATGRSSFDELLSHAPEACAASLAELLAAGAANPQGVL